MSHAPPVLVIVGPTASGKTALGVEVAARVGGEIISMDSRQVYRGMDIGTAKASAAERERVPHHGLDLVHPDERFNAGRFADYARQVIAEIQNRGAIPVLVGGTGFFLRALTHPIFREPPLDPERRQALESWLARQDDAELRRWLLALDPPAGERLRTWGGRQRLLRALELPLLTGRSLTWWHVNAPAEHPPLRPLTFLLQLPIAQLEERIDQRLADMVSAGLVAEVASLLQQGYGASSPGLNATGYVELLPYFAGEVSLEEALEQIRRNTRAYARRQLTWFRNQLPEGTIPLDASRPIDQLANEVLDHVYHAKGLEHRSTDSR